MDKLYTYLIKSYMYTHCDKPTLWYDSTSNIVTVPLGRLTGCHWFPLLFSFTMYVIPVMWILQLLFGVCHGRGVVIY